VVISGSGAHDRLPQATLAEVVDQQLRRLQPALGQRRWQRVIAERRATHACVPGTDAPLPGRIAPRLHLAGDYTDPDLPATLEAAVRPGHIAARSVIDELAKAQSLATSQCAGEAWREQA
jgi:monoamine oxidase